jgi:two-component system, sensor histidine kinase PdtaS
MDTSSTTKYIEELAEGSHITCIYKNDDQLFSLLALFFTQGFKKHKKCICVLKEEPFEETIRSFKEFGLDLAPHIKIGDFLFVKEKDFYLKNGKFNLDDVLIRAKKAETDALRNGYSGLYVSGNALWLNDNMKLESEFISYEAKVNLALQGSKINAICPYQEQLFDKTILIEMLRTHPIVYLYDRFVPNTYFAWSEDFLPLKHIASPEEEYRKLIAIF